MKKFLVAVATVAAVGLLGACGTSTEPGAELEPAVGTNQPPVESAPDVSITEPEPTESVSEPVAFGSTKAYTDGLEVTVSKGKSFKPSDTSAGSEGFKYFLKYTVTVVNGTGKTFDPNMISVTAQSANVEAAQIFDSVIDMGGSPSTKLLNGRESKFVVGYGVTDPKDVVMEITPDFEHESALFVN